MSALTHPRLAPRRTRPGGTWWSKAVLRAVEESAFSADELRRGRALARAGAVGAITVGEGQAVAAVTERDDVATVTITLPVLAEAEAQTLVELVAAESGRIAALLGGELPHSFVEAVEEAGIELLPYGGELGSACSCEAWLDPCPHALAVLTQLGWLIQADPFVLTHLRGLARDVVLGRLHELTSRRDDATDPASDCGVEGADEEDLSVGEDAAARAARALDLLSQGRSADHLW